MIKKLRGESGTALVIALSVLAMLSIIGIMSVKTSNIDMELSNFQVNNDKAFYAADAGAKRAILEVINNPDWNTGYTNYPIDKAFYTVGIENGSSNPALHDTIIITSTGLKEGGRATIEVTMVMQEIFSPIAYSMYARNGIDIQSNMQTGSFHSDSSKISNESRFQGGDLRSDGTITVKNNAIIGGEVSTSLAGGLNIFDPSNVVGTMKDNAPVANAPSIPQEDYNDARVNNSADMGGILGTYTYDPVTNYFRTSETVIFTAGTYYFSDFILDNAAEIYIPLDEKVKIYISGSATIKNSGSINNWGKPSDLFMYIENDFVLDNSAEMYGVLYAPDATVELNNSANFYGSIVAGDILCHSSSTFSYDRDLSAWGPGSSYECKLVAWREL